MNLIHLSDWAQQPDIRIKCTQGFTQPAWKEQQPGGPYEADNGQFYTFDKDKVTCRKCLMPTREEFIAAYIKIFPNVSSEFAGQVWDEFQAPDERFMENVKAVCDSVIERSNHDKTPGS